MKKTIAFAIALGLSFTAVADDAASNIQNCTSIAYLAKQVMLARQANVPMEKMLAVEIKDEALRPMLNRLVIAAFEQPRFSTRSNQEHSARDFSNQAMLTCVKTVGI